MTSSILTFTVAASAMGLSACTANPSAPVQDTATSAASASASGTAAPAASDTTAPSASASASAVDISQPVTLTYYEVGDKQPDSDRIWASINEKLKKDLNCTVDMITNMPWSDFQTKYPLIFASGEQFDFVFSANWCFYLQEAVKGAYMELKPEDIQQYMPLTYKAVTQDQWNATKVDGKIYMAPYTVPETSEGSKGTFLVRGDLMKKYNISSITTPQDILNYWDAVAKDTATTGIIPMAAGNMQQGYFEYKIAQAFGDQKYYSNKYFDTYVGASNQFYLMFDLTDPHGIKTIDATPYRMDTYNRLKDFYNKGYFGKDVATQTDQSETMFLNGKSATMFRALANLNNFWVQTMNQHPEWDPQIVDVTPDTPAWINPATNNGISIHAGSQNWQRAMMVMDKLGYDPSYQALKYGIEGTDYTKNSDGSITQNASFKGVSGFMGFYNIPFTYTTPFAPNYKDLRDSFSKNGISPALLNFNFDSSKVSSQLTAITAVEAQYLPLLNMGVAPDVQQTYDQMMAALKTAGLQTVQDEYIKQAQAFMTANY